MNLMETLESLNIGHFILFCLFGCFFILYLFSRGSLSRAEEENLFLEEEKKLLKEVLKNPKPFTSDDKGKEFIVYLVIHNGLVLLEGQSGFLNKMRFVPMTNTTIQFHKIKEGEIRIIFDSDNIPGE